MRDRMSEDNMNSEQDHTPRSAMVNSVDNAVAVAKASDLPAVKPAQVEEPMAGPFRLFHRQRPLHEILGSGKVADVILWRRRNATISILLCATAVWFLFECSGYTLLSLVTNVLLLLITILFVWSNAAAILNRPRPSVPELEVSEETINKISAVVRANINYGLKVSRELALGKDLKLFMKVAFVLWTLSTVGGWFNFLTLIYICLLVFLTVPAFYNKYEDHIDRYVDIAQKEVRKQYEKFDSHVLSKIPRGFSKEKKVL